MEFSQVSFLAIFSIYKGLKQLDGLSLRFNQWESGIQWLELGYGESSTEILLRSFHSQSTAHLLSSGF